MRGLLGFLLSVVLAAPIAAADEWSVDASPTADFTRFKTFTLGGTRVESGRPELDNDLFVKQVQAAIRSTLAARGLAETAAQGDLAVSVVITGEDVSTTGRGVSIAGPRGSGRISTGPVSVRYAAATLVIDLKAAGADAFVWRGVYRDEESTGSKLVAKLPSDAQKLLKEYPPSRPR
ncbi:MAG: DUF4136 domain-containing protein [Vicinamibacterales bacterium]